MPAQHTAWQQVQTGLTHQRQHKLTESWWPCSSTVTVSKGNQTMNVIIIHNELTSVGHHWWTLCLSMANIHNTGEHCIWLWVWQTFTTLVNTGYEYGKHSHHWWTRCMNITNIHNTGEQGVWTWQTFTTLVNTVYEYDKHLQSLTITVSIRPGVYKNIVHGVHYMHLVCQQQCLGTPLVILHTISQHNGI